MSDPAATPTLEREEAALAAALAWTTAATARDEAGARAATGAGRWDRGEDLLSDLFTQVARKGLIIEPIGIPHLCGPRGAQQATLSREGLGRPLGDLYLLLGEEEGAWRVLGATKVRPQVALFLSGQTDASDGPDALPLSEPALRWAALFLVEQALGGGDAAAALPAELSLAAAAGPGAALRAVHLVGTQRHAVELRFGEGPEAWQGWALLEGPDSALIPTDARRRLRWEALLRGLELRWPTAVDEAGPPAAAAALGPDELRAFIRTTMQAAMDAAMAESGELPAADPRRAAPTEIMRLLDLALSAAPMRLEEVVAAARAAAPAEAAAQGTAPATEPEGAAQGAAPATEAEGAAQGAAPATAAEGAAQGAAPATAAEGAAQGAAPATEAEGAAQGAAPAAEPEGAAAEGAAAEGAAPPPPTDAGPLRLPPKMQAAFGEVIAAHAKDGEAVVDANFLAQHGGELAGGLLRGLLQEVLPPTLELDVTVPKPAPNGHSVQAEPVKVRVDLGSVLQGLFRPRTPAAAPDPTKG